MSRIVTPVIRYTALVQIVITLLSYHSVDRTAIVGVVVIGAVVIVDVIGAARGGDRSGVGRNSAVRDTIFIGHDSVHGNVAVIDAVARYQVMVVIVDVCYYARCIGLHVIVVQNTHVEVARQQATHSNSHTHINTIRNCNHASA